MLSRSTRRITGIAVSFLFMAALPLFYVTRESNVPADTNAIDQDTIPASISTQVEADGLVEGAIVEGISISAEPNELPETQSDTQVNNTFRIEIPSINLTHEIAPTVDPTDEDEYLDILKKKVAHGKWTAFPSASNGNTYLFAHSKRRYDGTTPDGGWFTRIDELKKGHVIFINFHGEIYTYRVTAREVVSPLDVSVYTGNSIYSGHRSLTLQTCYPRGDISQRLIVYAIGE